MTRADRKRQIQALAEKTGKRHRGAANILNREEHRSQVLAADRQKVPDEPAASLSIRHLHLASPAQYELEVFSLNQTISTYSAKLKGWLSPQHRLDPHYAYAHWAAERPIGRRMAKPASEEELRELVARAMEAVEPFGHLLVVHAPGQISLMWSDHPLPRIVSEKIPAQMFGPPLKIVPRQPIEEGPPPTWWPDAKPRRDSVVHVRDMDKNLDHQNPYDSEMRLFAECSKCKAVSKTNGFDAMPGLFELNDGTAIKRAIEARLDPKSEKPDAGPHAAIVEGLASLWRDELRQRGCSHV